MISNLKKSLFLLSFCVFSTIANAQTASVEKSVVGIQTGFLGLWIYNEAKLKDALALRTELGFTAGFWGGSIYNRVGYLLTPVINIEPRWYYNLNKRSQKSKPIEGNSANFISLKTSYRPDWMVISNYDNIGVIQNFALIPTWGLRRNLGAHFNFEAGIGVGYRHFFGPSDNFGEAAFNLHLRIGYRF